MKVWITKYALTSGIEEIDAEYSLAGLNMVTESKASNYPRNFHNEGKDWHKTKESAIARAEEMRINKLKSLDKQIKKISAIVFD